MNAVIRSERALYAAMALILILALLVIPAPVFGQTCNHTVASGETLWGIAADNGMSVKSLRVLNAGFDLDSLLVGQTILVCTQYGIWSQPAREAPTTATPTNSRPSATPAPSTGRCHFVYKDGRLRLSC